MPIPKRQSPPAAICKNEDAPDAARIAAAVALLDRAWGKARQPAEPIDPRQLVTLIVER